jgi:hypothetical protein
VAGASDVDTEDRSRAGAPVDITLRFASSTWRGANWSSPATLRALHPPRHERSGRGLAQSYCSSAYALSCLYSDLSAASISIYDRRSIVIRI